MDDLLLTLVFREIVEFLFVEFEHETLVGSHAPFVFFLAAGAGPVEIAAGGTPEGGGGQLEAATRFEGVNRLRAVEAEIGQLFPQSTSVDQGGRALSAPGDLPRVPGYDVQGLLGHGGRLVSNGERGGACECGGRQKQENPTGRGTCHDSGSSRTLETNRRRRATRS